MRIIISNIYKELSTPEKNGKKIGLFRILCAIFGGLLVAYLGMSVVTLLSSGSPGENIIVPLLFNTMAWSISALWISLSPTKLSALLRTTIPSIIFTIIIIVMF